MKVGASQNPAFRFMRTRHGRALTGCLQLLYDAPMLVLWLAALLLAVGGSPLQPNQVYRVADPSITVSAPGVALKNDNALAVVVAPTLEACAAACRSNPLCNEFEHCDNDVSGRVGWLPATCGGCRRRRRSRRMNLRATGGWASGVPELAAAACLLQDGCTHQQPHLRHEDCRLMAGNCTLVPGVEAAGPWISRISGERAPRREVTA